ncbi:hypothetical protein DPMN_053951 [Dreissena polymorpha]|uniref:Uncharacterized protein n=1 Tax=Dreissena polymorpha TaxID=45954 RepID=A0A9D4HR70_DREPO|nr:hypothetical protein DPMN_053951 [Dreissena polymorpha]
MLKLAQTNRPTNQQTGQKQYVPHYSGGGHKNSCNHFGCAQDIMRTNVLTKFHEEINSLAPGRHVFQQTRTISELIQDILKTRIKLLTKFERKLLWTPPARRQGETIIRPVFLKRAYKNVLTKFHEDWTIKKTFRVLIRFYYYIIGTSLWTKFHEDRTINVASIVLTMQMLPPHNAQWTKGDHIVLRSDVRCGGLPNRQQGDDHRQYRHHNEKTAKREPDTPARNLDLWNIVPVMLQQNVLQTPEMNNKYQNSDAALPYSRGPLGAYYLENVELRRIRVLNETYNV